ncbi:MAG: hypothetical protein LBK44_07085, partial [Spirochaetales bacterium]|nr:hypothetical protein [Spirochaetales bacterium]
MRFLWAFRYNPLREWQLKTSLRNCHWQFRRRIIAVQLCAQNPAVAILPEAKLRGLSPSTQRSGVHV